MFRYSIDTKPEITDDNGNVIIDFVTPLFYKNSIGVNDYKVKRVTAEKYEMRPDLVSFAMYGDIDKAEYILKFSGISNPFTLSKDDVLKIPNDTEVYGMLAVNHPEDNTTTNRDTAADIRNYFKYYDPSLNKYDKNGESYKNLELKKIPSGIIKPSNPSNVMVPYISEDGRTAVIIRNGKIYFGENAGLNIAGTTTPTGSNITDTLNKAINNTVTELSDTNCMYNGTNLSDFVRANFNK